MAKLENIFRRGHAIPPISLTRPLILDVTGLFDEQFDPVCAGLAQGSLAQSKFIRVKDKKVFGVLPIEIESRLARFKPTVSMAKALENTLAWLRGANPMVPPHKPRKLRSMSWRYRLPFWVSPFLDDIEPGSLFLKAGFLGWSDPALALWLSGQKNLVPIALIGDPVWLDHPEYVRSDLVRRLNSDFAAIARLARALVVPTETARRRIVSALGETKIPVHVQSWPSNAAQAETLAPDDLSNVSYWVAPLPIEAGQNTLLLLTVWRDMIHKGLNVPKLILSGQRGRQIDQIVPLLDWGSVFREYVCEAPDLSPAALGMLFRKARGALLPAFIEETGNLARDLIRQGIPIIASDIPVFREIVADKACLLNPIDGLGWRDVILNSPMERSEPKRAGYLPNWPDFYRELDDFLKHL